MKLTSAQSDRAAGVLLGQACGDALGVPYEFGSTTLRPGEEPQMIGGGLGHYSPGEWSDDTQMAVCIAEVAAEGADLSGGEALDRIAAAFTAWYASGPADIGVQTSTLLGQVHRAGRTGHQTMLEASRRLHERTGRTAGNGALMRTGVVGLTRLDDRNATAASARAAAQLTHWDPLAGDSCVLWSEAVRRAVTEGVLDLSGGLDLLPVERRQDWAGWVRQSKESDPTAFRANGFTVTALQAAWSAITHTDTGDGSPSHLVRALHTAIGIGHDTDTVAAIAGALLGARYGVSAIPFALRRTVHGWPGLRARGLIRLALLTACGGTVGPGTWPNASIMDTGYERPRGVPLPADPGVLLGTTADLHRLSELGVDAIVSLCRLGHEEFARGVPVEDHAEIWLVDSDYPEANQHLEFALDDAARAVRTLRREGKRVLLHCVAAQHRTPAVALRYSHLLGVDRDTAARDITSALGVREIGGLLWSRASHG
ncbi:MAG: ADP-ribosylglycohydrolase family protein [Actinomycetota bacterium]|nr:ADP-ribosylglycohydrolase family protein [Actinomycetota bacterium]